MAKRKKEIKLIAFGFKVHGTKVPLKTSFTRKRKGTLFASYNVCNTDVGGVLSYGIFLSSSDTGIENHFVRIAHETALSRIPSFGMIETLFYNTTKIEKYNRKGYLADLDYFIDIFTTNILQFEKEQKSPPSVMEGKMG